MSDLRNDASPALRKAAEMMEEAVARLAAKFRTEDAARGIRTRATDFSWGRAGTGVRLGEREPRFRERTGGPRRPLLASEEADTCTD